MSPLVPPFRSSLVRFRERKRSPFVSLSAQRSVVFRGSPKSCYFDPSLLSRMGRFWGLNRMSPLGSISAEGSVFSLARLIDGGVSPKSFHFDPFSNEGLAELGG